MSIRNLDAIFRPRAVALIGASSRAHSVGLVTAQNLLGGGFPGKVMLVNPRHNEICGAPVFPNVRSLPEVPDLAVICTPAATVPGLMAELGARGTKGAIVITAGFRELGSEAGRALEQAMLDAAKPHLLRIIGPNCLGVMSTPRGLNASFAPGQSPPGTIAFVGQSGAMATTVLDWARSRGLGFSHLVSLGDMADVDFGDMLDWLANDPATTAILLYMEAVTQARKFMSAARAAARLKPVIAIKAGRHEAAARAAASHTGALAGRDAVYDAAFRRAGILRVFELEEIFDAVETLSRAPAPAGDSLTILTNGGGVGVLATDTLLDEGGALAALSPATRAKLDAVLPPTWSRGNPVDIIGDAPGSRYSDALRILLEAPETNAVLVLNCPTAVASSAEAARAVIHTAAEARRPVFVNWLGGAAAAESRALFLAANLPSYETPSQAVRGFMHLVHHRRGQETLLEVPPSVAVDFAPEEAAARGIVTSALSEGATWLAPMAVQEVLRAYAIPIVRSVLAADEDEAALLAEQFGTAVAVKVVSPQVAHKSDVGGVALNLQGGASVRAAAQAMRERVTRLRPDADISGFLVQEMVLRPQAYELIAGAATDAQFGPYILFGQGGIAVELIGDRAIALPPLNIALARELIGQTRIARQLRGFRDHAPVDMEALALTLVKLSQLLADVPEIAELDLNPLLVDAKGVVTLDARIRLAPASPQRLSISPYPRALVARLDLGGLGPAILRPIRPEDAPPLADFIAGLSSEDARLRFHTPLRQVDRHTLARLTQIDYDREMTLVLHDAAAEPAPFLAVTRLAADPDNISAEFAVVVRSDLHRRGLGRMMLQHVIAYARSRGLSQLQADIPADNAAMLALCREFGFSLTAAESGRLCHAELSLAAPVVSS